jgi:hypothetical protein
MNVAKQLSAKKAWSALKRDRDKFAWLFIACQALLLKSGTVTRQQVIENLNVAGVTQDDLKKFREPSE